MNIVNFGVQAQTMTSREIAELTGKQHKDVLYDIRRMLGELGLALADFSVQYKDSTGRMQPGFQLPLSVALTYLARVSKELGVKIMGEALKSSSVATEVLKALQDFEVPDDLPGMYVYAIRNTVTENVKLGISRNPEARLKQLQTGNDCLLELVAMRPAAARFADEKALHNANAHARLSGEWFDGSVSGYSIPMRARIIDRWESLETGKAVPAMVAQPYSAAVEAIQVADALAKMLRLEGSARLDVAQKAVKIRAPDLLPIVPVYAIDAPSGSGAVAAKTLHHH